MECGCRGEGELQRRTGSSSVVLEGWHSRLDTTESSSASQEKAHGHPRTTSGIHVFTQVTHVTQFLLHAGTGCGGPTAGKRAPGPPQRADSHWGVSVRDGKHGQRTVRSGCGKDLMEAKAWATALKGQARQHGTSPSGGVLPSQSSPP